MAYQWYVAVIDHRPGGQGEQDVSRYYDAARSRLSWGARGKSDQSTVVLVFDAPVFVAVPSKAQVIAGWRDPTSRQYQPGRRVFGAFVIEKAGTAEGPLHLLTLTTKGYGILAEEKIIMSWPTPDPDTVPQASYPADFPVSTWIAGTQDGGAPYDGLIPTYYPTIDTSGIDAVFDTILFTADDNNSMPGHPNPESENQFGLFSFCSIKAALDEVIKAAHSQNDAVRPMWFFDATTDRQTIYPRFNLIDLNSDLSSEVLFTAVSTNVVQTGQVLVAEPFEHSRDARKAQQAIIVKGAGSDTTAALLPNGTYPLNYALVFVQDHVNEYPNPYAVDGTWDLLLNVQDFATVDECRRYGQQVETQVWGARGVLTFDVWEVDLYEATGLRLDQIQIGKRIHYIDTMEGIDFVYPIINIESSDEPGAPMIHLTVGLQPLDIADLTIRGSAEMPWLRTGESARAYAEREANGVPPPLPVTRAPSNSNQNMIKARTKNVTAFRVQGSNQVRPGVAPDDAPLVPRANLMDATPAPDNTGDPIPDPNFFVGGDVTGGPGPQEYHFIGPKSGKGPLIFRAFTAKHVTVEGTGSVVVNRTGPSGTTASATLTGTGAVAGDHFTLAPTIAYARGDKLTLTITGSVTTALVSA